MPAIHAVQLSVVAVGKPRPLLGEAIAEYETRAGRYWPLAVQVVREEPARSTSPAQVCEREGERLLARVPATAAVVACDEGGRSFTSAQFAAWLGERRDAAQDVTFVIGGAYGLSPAVRARATMKLALAAWTLPHEMARLILAEQLYRAGTLLRGEPYHKIGSRNE